MISIHTFELSLETTSKDFEFLLSTAYKKAKENGTRLGYSTKHISHDVRVDDCLAAHGITIEYQNYDYRKMIKFRVNPSELLGGNDLQLWKPNTSNIDELLNRLDQYIRHYFNGNYKLNDFILNRVEFTANLNVGKENVPIYIRLMHKMGKVKKFSAKYGKSDYAEHKIDKEHSFDLVGNTNGIDFTAYDKEADLKKKGKKKKAQKAVGILRIEIRLKKRKAVQQALQELTDDEKLSTKKQIKIIAKNSTNIFMNNLIQIVPFGNFYKIKEAEDIIKSSDLKQNQKEKMLRLLRLVPEKKSLYLAQKSLSTRDVQDARKYLMLLNISPITISKRENANFLKNIYGYLDVPIKISYYDM